MIPKGTLFLLTEGEYSSYYCITLCKAIVDIDVEALKSEYLKLHHEQLEDYKFRTTMFVRWFLVDKRLAQELEYTEWHLGASKFELRESEKV
jgi:hypothetical protein